VSFALERPPGFDYSPGQHFYISIPAEGSGEKWLVHHFSFSSSPSEPGLEFTTRLTGHPFKDRMAALELGTRVRIDAPYGTFVLGDGMGKVAYICGGIGITPVRSMLRWAADDATGLDAVLLYANKDRESAAFFEELEALRSDRTRVVNVFSDPEPGWEGSTGHIDADVVRASVPDWRDRYFFVSGPPGMVTALSRMLAEQVGVQPERLVTEGFTGYK
jgi:ferredoxin-NADP reductase